MKINEKLEEILDKYPKIKNLVIQYIKCIFPEDNKKLKRIYFYNTIGFLSSNVLYYFLTNKISEDYSIASAIQYTIYNTISTLYLKSNSFKNYIKKFISYA